MPTTINADRCYCGDPNCHKCFPHTNAAYGRAMAVVQIESIRDICELALEQLRRGNTLRTEAALAQLDAAIRHWQGDPAE